MKKLSKTEKFVIAMVDTNRYITYQCPDHGAFQNRKDIDDGKCPYPSCKKNGTLVKDIQELKAKFKLELGV